MTEEKKARLMEAGIDFDAILDRIPGGEELIIRLLGKFLNEPCLRGLEEARLQKDYETAFLHAHTLKGVTANLEMRRLNEVTADLVERLRNKNTDGIENDFEAVKSEYEKVVNIIEEEIVELLQRNDTNG